MVSEDEQEQIKDDLLEHLKRISNKYMLGRLKLNVMVNSHTKSAKTKNYFVNDTTGHLEFIKPISNELFLMYVKDDELKFKSRTIVPRINSYANFTDEINVPPLKLNLFNLTEARYNVYLICIHDDLITARVMDEQVNFLLNQTKTTFENERGVINPIRNHNYMHFCPNKKKWFRNKIINTEKYNVRVELIDFGKVEIIQMWQLRELPVNYHFEVKCFNFKIRGVDDAYLDNFTYYMNEEVCVEIIDFENDIPIGIIFYDDESLGSYNDYDVEKIEKCVT